MAHSMVHTRAPDVEVQANLRQGDWRRHNAEVHRLWSDYAAGRPSRVPMVVRVPVRFSLQRRDINVEGYTFKEYYDNPEIMWEMQLRCQRWKRTHLPCDHYMGYPKQWDGVYVDFHGGLEAVWLGNQPAYFDRNVMDSYPALQEHKERLYDWAPPDPRHGPLMERMYEYYAYLEDKRTRCDYDGVPVGPTQLLLGTDGPFTTATKLRGTSEVCLDMLTDSEYYRELMEYITAASIRRMQDGMEFMGRRFPNPIWGYADCTVCILSKPHFRQFVLPYHQRIMDAFSTGPYNHLHSCGPVHHLHKMIHDHARVTAFDCGFITDAAYSRRECGPTVSYSWRFHPVLQSSASEAEVVAAVRKMMASGVTEGRRFTIEEVAYPEVSLDRWGRFYGTVKELGRYPAGASKQEGPDDWFLARGMLEAPGDL